MNDPEKVIDTAFRDLDHAHFVVTKQQARIAELEAQVGRLRTAIVNAALHVEELRDAWERGAISEHDGKGGTRSNRNFEIVLELKAALETTP